jgi:hypothetical protein
MKEPPVILCAHYNTIMRVSSEGPEGVLPMTMAEY